MANVGGMHMPELVGDTEAMLLIKSIAPDASLKLSDWTGKWYVEARIDVGDGAVLTGITEHRGTTHDAIFAFLRVLTDVSVQQTEHFLVTRHGDQRREWKWNGRAFVETTQEAAWG